MKVFLLTYLIDYFSAYRRDVCTATKKTAWSYGSISALNNLSIQTCLISLVEQTLHKLLPRLQTLLLQRHHTDWVSVVSAMSALAMTADQWFFIDSYPHLAGQFCAFENGWNVLLSLYTAAYGGYHPLRVSPINKFTTAQSDETAMRLSDELRIWVERNGM